MRARLESPDPPGGDRLARQLDRQAAKLLPLCLMLAQSGWDLCT